MNRLNRRIVGVVLLSLYSVGCYKYTTVAGDPREAVASETVWLRVTDMEGKQVLLYQPVIRNDSITQGEAKPCQVVAYERTECDTATLSFALDEVAQLEIREAGAAVPFLLMVAGVGLIFSLSQLHAWTGHSD